MLRGSSASRADGNRARTAAALPSAEALSTTITASGARLCACTAASASSSRSSRLYVTTTAITRGGSSLLAPWPPISGTAAPPPAAGLPGLSLVSGTLATSPGPGSLEFPPGQDAEPAHGRGPAAELAHRPLGARPGRHGRLE